MIIKTNKTTSSTTATVTTTTSTTTTTTTSTTTTSTTLTSTTSISSSIDHQIIINDFLYQHLGPQQALPLLWLIIMTLVYIFILLTGLIGNIITILVIFRFRYMQTITNLYLCNLAITDLISLMFSLPLELYTLWHQYPWQLGSVMCSMKTLILEGTANASVLTLVAFTVERFLAICGSSSKHQTIYQSSTQTQTLFNFKSIKQLKRLAYRNIIIIWMISITGAMPLVLLTNINYLEYNQKQLKQSAWCGLAYNEPDKRWELIMLSSTIIYFLIPLLLITYLYYKIAKKLNQASNLDKLNYQQSLIQMPTQQQQQQQQQDNIIQLNDHVISRKILQSRKIVIRMLVVIVIVFTFCWSPFHAQRLLFLYVTLYSSWNMVLRQINGILFLSAGCLYYLNSSLNPLIYSLLSTRFRAAFMLYVQQCCLNRRNRHLYNQQNRNSRSRHNLNSSQSGGNSHQHYQQRQNSNSCNNSCCNKNQKKTFNNNGKKSKSSNNENSSIILLNENVNVNINNDKIPSIVMTTTDIVINCKNQNNQNNQNVKRQKNSNKLQLPKHHHHGYCKFQYNHYHKNHHHHHHHHSQNNFQEMDNESLKISTQNSW